MNYITLSNGVKMPQLGYGVFQIPSADAESCVTDAISVGYRSIDTAQAYGNEEGVGNAVKKSGIDREQFFITTKIWISNASYEKAAASIDNSLKLLQTDYIDLMLIHQPFGDYYGTWRAMEDAYKAGKLRAIGVSNFYPDRLVDLASFNEIMPMVNQVETHIFWQQKYARKFMDKYNCAHMSWGPLAEGKNGFFTNEVLTEIGTKYGKSVAQTALRFLLQKGVILIPKSTHKERMEQNFNIFDFELTNDDLAKIEALDTGKSIMIEHQTGEAAEQFVSWSK